MISTPFVLLIRSSIDIYIQSSIDIYIRSSIDIHIRSSIEYVHQSRIKLYRVKIGALSVNKKLTLRQIFVGGASVVFIDCGKMRYLFLMRTIILRAKSKKTIFGLVFCMMSRWARESSSMMPMTLFSLMNGANLTAKSASVSFM